MSVPHTPEWYGDKMVAAVKSGDENLARALVNEAMWKSAREERHRCLVFVKRWRSAMTVGCDEVTTAIFDGNSA